MQTTRACPCSCTTLSVDCLFSSREVLRCSDVCLPALNGTCNCVTFGSKTHKDSWHKTRGQTQRRASVSTPLAPPIFFVKKHLDSSAAACPGHHHHQATSASSSRAGRHHVRHQSLVHHAQQRAAEEWWACAQRQQPQPQSACVCSQVGCKPASSANIPPACYPPLPPTLSPGAAAACPAAGFASYQAT